MNPWIGWALAVVAVAVAYASWGWPGVVLALTLVVFWLLLQFSRSLRVMRMAAGRPVGQIDNAVMLHVKLRPGMRLLEILPLTRSLGVKVADEPETFRWTDGAGDAVQVELVAGRATTVTLQRQAPDAPGDGPAAS